jgi:hypothetical protein
MESQSKKYSPEEKAATHRFYLFQLSCQLPKEFYGTPEQSQFDRAFELTGKSVADTQWDVVYGQLRRECPVVWQKSIELSLRALGLSDPSTSNDVSSKNGGD